MTSPGADVRSSASRILDRTLGGRQPVGRLLDPALARLSSRDRRLLQQLVLGVLRRLRRLDDLIEFASGRRSGQIDAKLLSPLRVGAHQLFYLDRIPAHAAVDGAVGDARRRSHRGGAGFVNAVLRKMARAPELEAWPVREKNPLRRLAIEESHPDVLVERWHERLGDAATRRLLAANNRPKPMHLLAFAVRGGRQVLARHLLAEGVDCELSVLAPQGLIVRQGNPLETEAFGRGEFYIQDEASQAAALLPPPTAGERVLDAAASPGGKSFALLASQPDLRIVAADAAPRRLRELLHNRARLGLHLPVLAADARRPAVAEGFQRVMADLPCTGTGTLRKHPELKWRFTLGELTRLADQGLRILEGLAPLVAPGGRQVVMTCSLEPEENEAVVEAFLARHDDFHLEPLAEGLGESLAEHLEEPTRWRILPGGDHDGFTVHSLRRA